MKKKRLQTFVLLLVGITAAYFAGSSTQAQKANAAKQQMLLNDYCVSCHNLKAKTAGIVLENLDLNHIAVNTETWEKVLRKVRTGQMPPASAPKPEAQEAKAFADWLETELDRSARLQENGPQRP